ncbi:MAG: hypothetical protein ACOZQL_10720 [Myxococcota bacterium]
MPIDMDLSSTSALSDTDVLSCARCGGNHENIETFAFTNPIAPAELAPFKWTHWAMCPVKGEPILIGVGHRCDDAAVLEAHADNAYAAYGRSTGGLNHRGEPMPKWLELPEKIRDAWRAAVRAVLR